ncbi:hypothetical protein SLA2020_417530 [Shorea laevis]
MEVLRLGSLATAHGDLVGKDCDVVDILLGVDHSDVYQSPFAQDKASWPFDDAFKDDGRPLGKEKMKSLLWAWKGQLVKAK